MVTKIRLNSESFEWFHNLGLLPDKINIFWNCIFRNWRNQNLVICLMMDKISEFIYVYIYKWVYTYIYVYFFLCNPLKYPLSTAIFGLCSCKGVSTEFVCSIITFQETLAVIQLSWIDGSYTFVYVTGSPCLRKEPVTWGVAERCQGNQQLEGTENTRFNVCICDKHFNPERKGWITKLGSTSPKKCSPG